MRPETGLQMRERGAEGAEVHDQETVCTTSIQTAPKQGCSVSAQERVN